MDLRDAFTRQVGAADAVLGGGSRARAAAPYLRARRALAGAYRDIERRDFAHPASPAVAKAIQYMILRKGMLLARRDRLEPRDAGRAATRQPCWRCRQPVYSVRTGCRPCIPPQEVIMAIAHAVSGRPVSVLPHGAALRGNKARRFWKTERLR